MFSDYIFLMKIIELQFYLFFYEMIYLISQNRGFGENFNFQIFAHFHHNFIQFDSINVLMYILHRITLFIAINLNQQ